MIFIDITGQPCAGKSSFIEKEVMKSKRIYTYKKTFRKSLLYLFSGINYLGFQRTKVLLFWSLKENASFIFRINIFRNAVLKFGIFYNLEKLSQKDSQKTLVDEGLSHLPFLFLNTETKQVVDFISHELQNVNVWFLKSPEYDIIKSRLTTRGHKRLKFLPVTYFVKKNKEIEDVLLNIYPKLCKELIIL
tara:strand:- start:4699 stop:5268 length:570 start_codon:yes stop_codon:yes gene_type:complete